MIFPRSLNARILIGAAVGIAIGLVVLESGPAASFSAPVLYGAKIVGTVFLDLLRMVLLPLVFSSIVVGVANLQAHHQMHRVWKLTLGFFVLSMAIAIIIGFGAAHLFRPGDGMQLSMFAEATASFQARQMPL
ncbi:MAG: cation:dicarboxylase symporter family transporter, partial [Rhodocyclaceae bacterium]